MLNNLPKTPEKQLIYAATLEIEGQLKLASGDPQQALSLWQESETIYQTLPDVNDSKIIANQINQAQAMQSLGLYPQACQTLLSSLGLDDQSCQISETDLDSLTTDHSDISLQILSLRSLSKVLRVIGNLEDSQQVLQKSLLLALRSSNEAELAAIYLELGNTAHAFALQATPSQQKKWLENSSRIDQCTMREINLDMINPNQLAIACYRQAVSEVVSETTIQAQLNLLTLAIQTSQWREVQSLLNQLPPALERLSVSGSTIDARLKFSQALMCLRSENTLENRQANSPLLQSCPTINHEDFKRAALTVPSWDVIRQQINIAQSQAKILGNQKIAASAAGYLAATYQQQQAWGTAQQLTEKALQNLSAYNNPEWVYLWQWQLGRLYRQQNQSDNAIAAYTLSWRILQSLRQELVATNTDVQYAFRERVEPVYRELADLLLQPSQNPTEKSEKISPENLEKAREIIESLQLAELNNFFQEACLESTPQQIDQIDTKAAVIYSIILPGRLSTILSLPNRALEYYETSFDNTTETSELETVYQDFLGILSRYYVSSEPLVPAQKLYNWLIRPGEIALKENKIETLVFVLDGKLRKLPVTVLHDGQQYLIEKYKIALTPGLQLFNPQPFSLADSRVLVGGLSEARQGFSALPNVQQEVEDIKKITPSQILLNQDFTSNQLEKELESNVFPVVHLATHGRFSSQAKDTFVLAWDGPVNVKNLDQLLRNSNVNNGQNNFYTQTPIDLLILSACQTAEGDDRAALGLAGVAVRSGARSTVATLWKIEDKSTAVLMSRFYEALNQQNITKAEALRQAQLSLLESPQYKKPFYWASFVLVGDWL